MEAMMQSLQAWLRSTYFSHNVMHSHWAWPTSESLHFIGLCLLIGAIGLFDLRMMGFAKSVPLGALHSLVPWGILGYCINIVTGISFLVGEPDQYIYNIAFQFKILFMAFAGINVLVFYLTVYRQVNTVGAGEDAPLRARIIAVVSLACWIGVIICGRLLTFYRPPLISCPWC